jgi:gliding motility-associated-like protein
MTSEYALYVPNSFTPNGDGKNELFYIKGNSIDTENFLLRIYNRWGELLFETNDINQGWDGTHNGKPVQTGTYIWDVELKELYTPRKHHHTGHVNVLN